MDPADPIEWRQYRQMRLFYWAAFSAAVAFVVFGSDDKALIALVVMAVLSMGVAFWPCPRCGGRVGYIGLGPLMMLWPFGGWCTTCSRKLFGRK